MRTSYEPRSTRLATFHDAAGDFRAGASSPRAYLEACIEVIEAREPVVRAFTVTNLEVARAAADASAARYRAGRPLSPIDGLPVGIKDLFETRDMPVEMGSELWKGFQSFRDAAHVHALREAGAIVVGKTVTTEFGMNHPGPTTNPFDPSRTPGGSSSGSAAAVGAAMLPVAIGSQVVGSVIRPAGYCANFAFKPTFGALNRGGGHSALSQSHLGVHAGCVEDLWPVMFAIHRIAGGDPGLPGLIGGSATPQPRLPGRLVHVATDGWADTDASTRAAYESTLDWIRSLGVEVVSGHPGPVEEFEASIAGAQPLSQDICAYELRWPLAAYRALDARWLSDSIRRRLERGEAMTADDYRECLVRRDRARTALAGLRGIGDAVVTLSQTGPAPLGLESTGDAVFNAPASLLGAPAVTLPMMAVEGMPVGLQLFGFAHEDANLVALARGIWSEFLAS